MFAPLSLAMKYQMDDLKTKIVTIIERDWPSTLKRWDVFSKRTEDLRKTPDLILADHMPEPASAIRLALICKELRKILPAAYNQLCTIHPTDAFETRQQIHYDQKHKTFARWSLLSPESITICLNARMQFNEKSNTFREIFMTIIRRLVLGNESHNAQTVAACRLGLLRMCDSFFSDYALHHDLLNSTLRFKQKPGTLTIDWEICKSCASEVSRSFDRKRVELWNDLPEIFNIGELFDYGFI